MSQAVNHRTEVDVEALRMMSQEISERENRLQAAEQTYNNTLEVIARTEKKNVNLKSTIASASTITSSSVSYIALSAFSAPVALTLAGAVGAGYVTYRIVKYLTRE